MVTGEELTFPWNRLSSSLYPTHLFPTPVTDLHTNEDQIAPATSDSTFYRQLCFCIFHFLIYAPKKKKCNVIKYYRVISGIEYTKIKKYKYFKIKDHGNTTWVVKNETTLDSRYRFFCIFAWVKIFERTRYNF